MNIEIKNKIIIISSPSGAGKTTLCKMILKKTKNIILSISFTSRSKRLNEVDGKDYFFVSKEKFLKLKKNNYFIESCNNFNNYYGSPIKNIKNANSLNCNILFDSWFSSSEEFEKLKKKNFLN